MKVAIVLLVAIAVLHIESTDAQGFFRRSYNSARDFGRRSYKYARDFAGGSRDMFRAYRDMRKANTIGADKYFHARGNYDAAQRGPGGRHAATVLSNAREWYQGSLSGAGPKDTAADQAANRWGRGGRNPNKYRPRGLDKRY